MLEGHDCSSMVTESPGSVIVSVIRGLLEET